MTRLGTTRLAAVISTPKRYLARCTRREQVSLLAGSLLVMLTAGWLLIWQPVFSARSASQARLMSAQDTLAQVNGMAAELAQLRSAAPLMRHA